MACFQSAGPALAYDDIRPAGGESGTVVLVHGFATNRAETWRRLGWLTAFERRGWRAVALDLRGHGTSDKPHDPALYARGDMAGDIVALMDHLGVERADLMGYSLGAHLCLTAALGRPDRFSSLILGGVGARMARGAVPPPTRSMTMGQAMRAEDPAAIPDPILRSFRRFADEQGEDRLALAACAEGVATAPSRDDLSALAIPAVVIAGSRDEIAGDPRGLADAIPGAKAVSLPACDHFSAIPHALFKAAVFDFLEGWED
ncbi:MAG: alpha/beta fold hydrolase [Caulobacteraceae bacterium]|nr:alpha/beta fold hydrolase [Caulobacteraceae bacterium]